MSQDIRANVHVMPRDSLLQLFETRQDLFVDDDEAEVLHFTRHTLHVTRHTSQLTRHTSHVTHHTSHVTRQVAYERSDLEGVDIFDVDVTGNPPLSPPLHS